MSQEPHHFPGLLSSGKNDATWIVELLRKIFGMRKLGWSAIIWLLPVQLIPLFPDWAENLTREWKEDIQVPMGVNSQGLPIGLQVMAAPYNDALCLAVAKYLDKEFGGAVMACKKQ